MTNCISSGVASRTMKEGGKSDESKPGLPRAPRRANLVSQMSSRQRDGKRTFSIAYEIQCRLDSLSIRMNPETNSSVLSRKTTREVLAPGPAEGASAT